MLGLWRPVGWAFYLACSWTWCIGMFLPAIMLRDFGWWGYAVFAAPNIIGAAAMGLIAPAGGELAAWAAAHGRAIRWFSRVTIAFHLYFVGMLLGPILPVWSVMIGAVLVALMLTVTRLFPRRAAVLAAAVWAASAVIALAFLMTRGTPDPAPLLSRAAPLEAIPMLAVTALGFGLCPYLDATFQHARQRSGAQAPLAFVLGFAVLFAAMIAFTAVYAPLLPWLGSGAIAGGLTATLLSGHILLQSGFTVAVHADRVIAGETRGPTERPGGAAVGLAAGLLIGIGFLSRAIPGVAGLSFPEVGYRVFMACYGLVFPAYAWIVALRGGFAADRPSRAEIRAFGAAVALAAPFYTVGLLWGPAWWVVPGVAIVVAGRFAVPLFHRRDACATDGGYGRDACATDGGDGRDACATSITAGDHEPEPRSA